MMGADRPMLENGGILVTFMRILNGPLHLARVEELVRTAMPGNILVTLVFLVLGIGLVFGLAVLALRGVPFLVFSLAGFVGTAVVLNLLQVLPFRDARLFLFIFPVSLSVYAVGLTEAMARLSRVLPRPARWAGALCTTVVFVSLSASGIINYALQRRSQEVRVLLDEISLRAPDVPVWVYWGAQPATALLAPTNMRLLGLFDFASGEVAWGIRGGGYTTIKLEDRGFAWRPVAGYPATIVEAAAGAPALWLLFAHDFKESTHETFLASAAAATGPCTLIKQANESSLYFCGSRIP